MACTGQAEGFQGSRSPAGGVSECLCFGVPRTAWGSPGGRERRTHETAREACRVEAEPVGERGDFLPSLSVGPLESGRMKWCFRGHALLFYYYWFKDLLIVPVDSWNAPKGQGSG